MKFCELKDGDRFRVLAPLPTLTKQGCYGRTDDGYKYRIDDDREVKKC